MTPDHEAQSVATKAIHGFGALQDEFEFAMLLSMVKAMKPSKIVEIGSHKGGSLYAWRWICDRVIGVTLGDSIQFHSHGASMIYGDSTAPETQRAIMDATRGQADFVFVDGGHDEATARSDVDLAISLAFQSQGVVGIHDINLHHRYPELCGPRVVWNEYSRQYPSMEFSNVVKDDPGFGLLWIV